MMLSYRTECTFLLKTPAVSGLMLPEHGEVEYFSILDNKAATKSYWERKMLASLEDDWETVANVQFQPDGHKKVEVERIESPVTPPLEFLPAPPEQFENEGAAEQDGPSPDSAPPGPLVPPVQKQYVFGSDEEQKQQALQQTKPPTKLAQSPAVTPTTEAPPPLDNLIEEEIRVQQQKEEELRLEKREKGASSPASHDSDEGFVERLNDVALEENHAQDQEVQTHVGYTHALQGADGETIIYDAVSPTGTEIVQTISPDQSVASKAPASPAHFSEKSTETRIALEIQEMRAREEELRKLREEQLSSSQENLLLEDDDEEDEAGSSGSRDDHFVSLTTTTTDEGNFSECGDTAGSEDKSSEGSNSRIMSPDLPSFTAQAPAQVAAPLETRGRRITVKPFQEEDIEEELPVYTRMKKESVIEREIRLAREREEAFRREQGLLSSTKRTPVVSRSSAFTNTVYSSSSPSPTRAPTAARTVEEADRRDVQHRIATSRIQQEISENSQKEKELFDAGKILTLSEDTVDAKVTRLSDLAENSAAPRSRPSSVKESPAANGSFHKRSDSPVSSVGSPYSPPNFTPSPTPRLTRSLSTNNLSSSSQSVRPTKGLMQKFIASRGKLSAQTFISPMPSNAEASHTLPSTAKGVPTRLMRMEPKAAVVQREQQARTEEQKLQFKRTVCSAEEKIQEELKEMQKREEELRQLRIRQLGLSQPNLMDVVSVSEEEFSEGPSLNGSYLAPPSLANNGLEETDEPKSNRSFSSEKKPRRRSALIAQWETIIQQTAETS